MRRSALTATTTCWARTCRPRGASIRRRLKATACCYRATTTTSMTSSVISLLTAGARRSAGSTALNGTASTGWCALPMYVTMMMRAFHATPSLLTHGAMSMTSSAGVSARPTRKQENPLCFSGRTTGWSPSATKRTRILPPA